MSRNIAAVGTSFSFQRDGVCAAGPLRPVFHPPPRRHSAPHSAPSAPSAFTPSPLCSPPPRLSLLAPSAPASSHALYDR